MTEIWKPVVGAEDLYEVSDQGRVRSIKRAMLMRPCANRSGHTTIDIRRKRQYVHRMVLEAFVGPPPDGTKISRHLNGDPSDNRLTNLAWGTQAENVDDAYRYSAATMGRLLERMSAIETDIATIKAHLGL